jgi:hypothetical protein
MRIHERPLALPIGADEEAAQFIALLGRLIENLDRLTKE